METAVKTLEDSFNIDINYYGRVNFTSLVNMVDILGGIDIINENEFISDLGKVKFLEGEIHLDGEQALSYVKEREDIPAGDVGRSENYEKILTAMIKKATAPEALLNYSGLVGIIKDSAELNVPKEKIIELVNMQVERGNQWEILSAEIAGEGQYGLPSYAMPDHEVFMYVPEKESLLEAGRKIKSVMEE